MEREMRPARRAVKYIEEIIRTFRGQKVILDTDLAALYGVETGALNRAVKRNARRFPSDFVFRLTAEEHEALRCQIGISKGKGGRRYVPNAFTEHGAVMAANVLNSIQAVDMSVYTASREACPPSSSRSSSLPTSFGLKAMTQYEKCSIRGKPHR